MEQTFWKEQPWMVLTYLRTDEEADAAGGMAVDVECCMCGATRHFEFPILPADWRERGLDSEQFYATHRGIAEAYMRTKHLHPELHGKPPGMFWAKPLRNPDAWQIDWSQIARRIAEDVAGMAGEKS